MHSIGNAFVCLSKWGQERHGNLPNLCCTPRFFSLPVSLFHCIHCILFMQKKSSISEKYVTLYWHLIELMHFTASTQSGKIQCWYFISISVHFMCLLSSYQMQSFYFVELIQCKLASIQVKRNLISQFLGVNWICSVSIKIFIYFLWLRVKSRTFSFSSLDHFECFQHVWIPRTMEWNFN